MTGSALFGNPPTNSDDYYIVKYMYESAGVLHFNASKGIKIPPARPPPSEYQFESRGPVIIAGLSVCIVLMSVVTGLRLYVRVFNKNLKAGLDDVLIIPGVLLAIAYPALQIAMVQYGGAGKHMYDVTYHEFYIFHWLSAVAQIDFFIAVGVVKMSITAFNMRLSSVWNKRWKYAHWMFFILLGAYTLAAFFLNVFTCTPAVASYSAIQAGKLQDGFKCMSIKQLGTILRAINITMDFLLLGTPIIILARVQMDFLKKVKLFVVFGFGALACIGSVMTLVAKGQLKTDTMYNYTTLLAWTLVEITIGVVTASLPILSALLPGRSWLGIRKPKDYPTPRFAPGHAPFETQTESTAAPSTWLSTLTTDYRDELLNRETTGVAAPIVQQIPEHDRASEDAMATPYDDEKRPGIVHADSDDSLTDQRDKNLDDPKSSGSSASIP